MADSALEQQIQSLKDQISEVDNKATLEEGGPKNQLQQESVRLSRQLKNLQAQLAAQKKAEEETTSTTDDTTTDNTTTDDTTTTEEEDDGSLKEDEVKEKLLSQATQEELDPEQKVNFEIQKVQDDELLDDTEKTVTAPTVDSPATIDAASLEQTAPEKEDVKAYTAGKAEPDVGEAEAAKGELSDESIMVAAQGELSPESLAVAATQELDPKATTQYQIASLMSSIKAGQELPPWASPAVRKVSSIMQQRGLGASSMAAAATLQAVMESGIPIAAADANKYATIQLANLNNEQAAALSNAAASAAMDMANLNNRQQAAVNNAKSFLAMDMANLTNEQAAKTLTYQSKTSALLSDVAAENAANQFNAKSENEVNMFFAELGASIEQTSLNRKFAVEQFNIGQKTAVDEFNAQMEIQRDQFNANMQLQIDQSNVVWRRKLNTAETATKNEENRLNVTTLLGIQQNAMNNIWQAYRDQASWNMKISENSKDRAHNAAMQSAAISNNKDMYEDKFEDYLITKTIDNLFG